MRYYKNLLALGCVASLAFGAAAQADQPFDLSSQRKEKQRLLPVPGKKVENRPFVVNPTPQNIAMHSNRKGVNAGAGFNLAGVPAKLADVVNLKRNPKGTKVTVNVGASKNVKGKGGVEPREGAYILEVGPKGVDIRAYDEAGAYYALQTLRQLAATSKGGVIPAMTINDYPSLSRRGLVEGFYGNPWSHEVRKSLIRFLGENKLNTFIFAPKDDPYHSSPHWRKPYPADQAAKIRELAKVAKDNHVNFVWAIHPGKDIRWNKEDYDSLVNKFDNMYDLGVRSFFIFFDDISGEGTNPNKQVELLNKLNREWVQKKQGVSNITMCPTDYSRSWANPTPKGSLAIFGRTLDKNIDVMYTGDAVCSDLTRETMEFFNPLVQRPGYYWWNFPVSDYCRNIILQGPSYGLDTTLTDKEVTALVSNPMEHGEASKLALYGVADYSWNIPAYNAIDSWERALEVMMPRNPRAYRTFAIHNCDTETGYRRDESWETQTFGYKDYTPEQFDALKRDFEEVAAARRDFEVACDDSLLIRELRPWLVEFEKLGQRGLRTLELIKMFPTAAPADFWNLYVTNLMTPDDIAAYTAHKTGTLKLNPFYTENMDGMLDDFYIRLAGEPPMMFRPLGSFRNIQTEGAKLMQDGNLATYYHTGQGQRKGDWVGLDLRKVSPVSSVDIRQGRNDTDDVDFFDHAVLEVSKDGREWTPLINELTNQYGITWSGDPVEARYVRLRRLDSNRSNWMSVREFNVGVDRGNAVWSITAPVNILDIERAADGNPTTFGYLNPQGATITRKAGADKLRLLMGVNPDVTVTQVDAAGKELGTTHITTPYGEVQLNPATETIQLSGAAIIYEIL